MTLHLPSSLSTVFRAPLMAAFLSATALSLSAPAHAETPDVVVSIKPVHSLVAAVMEGIGSPKLIVDGAASPHSYALRPSQARELQKADVVFWVGHELEAFLEKPLESLGGNARVVELADLPDLTLLPFRSGGAFEAHEHHHDDDGHEDHHEGHHEDAHGEAHGDAHGEKHADKDDHHEGEDHDHEKDHGHEDHDDHHGGTDPHVWLDPANARVLVREVAHVLGEADPEHGPEYEANATALVDRLTDLETELAASLSPVRERPYIVFHDAYHYFENRFGMAPAGSITISPEVAPGAKRVSEIRHKIEESGAACAFAEPQFEPAIIATATEGTGARTATLDPLGADIPAGPEGYFTLLRTMAKSLADCLGAK